MRNTNEIDSVLERLHMCWSEKTDIRPQIEHTIADVEDMQILAHIGKIQNIQLNDVKKMLSYYGYF